MIKIIAQIFGVGAMVTLFQVYQQNDRKKLLFFKLCADVCWVLHYFCLGAWGGLVPNLVGIFRELVFVNREKKKWANIILWPIFFIILNLILGFLTLSSPINLLPICASTFVTLSLWLKKPTLTKIILTPVCASFLIYDVFVGSWVGIINESLSILSLAISFIKSEKEQRRKRMNQNPS